MNTIETTPGVATAAHEESTVDDLRVPVPLYRHAAPSAPWPWMDFKRDVQVVGASSSGAVYGTSATSTLVDGESEGQAHAWCGYPQSLFGNWTGDQVRRCRMFEVMSGAGDGGGCAVYRVDMVRGGTFYGGGEDGDGDGDGDVVALDDPRAQEAFWTDLQTPRDPRVRLRALFVDRMSGPALQILGTRYNVEPFFFSSSANWIPSRYEEDVRPGEGDHITVVLPFVRVIRHARVAAEGGGVIDTQAPLHLSDGVLLLQDLLAFHVVRTTTSDTILSYHPDSPLRRGAARRLSALLRRTGESVYWTQLYERCGDPTIVLLALLWHAAYAWDEALEALYDYLNKTLEAGAPSTEHAGHTRALHGVRAHLICYQQLLWDFRATVAFVGATPNPAMDAETARGERASAAEVVRQEADTLLGEIERMETQREMQTERVVNAMSLAISTVKSEETRAMHGLTGLTVRDAATTKQMSYFTLAFLPSYFLAGVFRMNVKEVNPNATQTLAHYVAGTIVFTLCATWLVIAMQETSTFHPGGWHLVRRVGWPVFYASERVRRARWGKGGVGGWWWR